MPLTGSLPKWLQGPRQGQAEPRVGVQASKWVVVAKALDRHEEESEVTGTLTSVPKLDATITIGRVTFFATAKMKIALI